MDCLIYEKKNEEKCWKTHNPKDTEADPKCDSFLKGESNFQFFFANVETKLRCILLMPLYH